MHKIKTLTFVPCLYFFSVMHYRAQAQTPENSGRSLLMPAMGGTDNGAVGQYEHSPSIQGKDVTLDIALKVVAELKETIAEKSISFQPVQRIFTRIPAKSAYRQ